MAKLTNRLVSQATAAGGYTTKKKPTTAAGTTLESLGSLLKRQAGQIQKTTTTAAPKQTTAQSGAASTTRRTGSTASAAPGTPVPAAEATTPRGVTYDPATTTPGAADLKQIEGTMPTYKQSQALTDALAELNSWRGTQPGDYQSPYASQIESLYDKVSNPEKFSYDPNADPLYQMYADRYGQNARRSMNDTMADAAALTGGYGNSYAQAVAQQAYDEQMQGLNDALPTLYNQAYGEYTDRQNQLINQLQTAQAMDETAYGRYRDTVSDYYTGLDALTKAANDLYEREYGQYTDALKQANTDRDYYLTKAASEAAAASGSGGGSGRGTRGTGTSANYKTILNLAKGMDAGDAYNYVARMADQGYITNEEADKMLNMNLGVDVSQYVTSGGTSAQSSAAGSGALASLAGLLTGKKSTTKKTPTASSTKMAASRTTSTKKTDTAKTKYNKNKLR